MSRYTAPVIDAPIQTSRTTPARTAAALTSNTPKPTPVVKPTLTNTAPSAQAVLYKQTVSTIAPTQQPTVNNTRLGYVPTPTQVIIDNNQDAGLVRTVVQQANTVTVQTNIANVTTGARVTAAQSATNALANATTVISQRITNINNAPGTLGATGGIQFYDGKTFASDKDFKYDAGTDTLTLTGKLLAGNLSVSGHANFGQLANISMLGGSQGQLLQTNGSGSLSWITHYSNVNTAAFLTTYTGNLSANIITARTTNSLAINTNSINANTVVSANLAVSGNAILPPMANVTTANLTVTGNAVLPTLNSLAVTGNANLGSVNTLTITGGSNGQVLTTAGNGALRWATISANGNVALTSEITNGSSNVIVNADSNVTFGVAGQSEVLTITPAGAQANLFTSNNYTLGNSTTTISTNRWMDAMTATINPSVLFSASNAFSSIDIHVTANGGNSKQISKMLSVTQGTTTHYSQYGNVTIGDELAAFTMDQSSGLVRVIARPTTSNRVDYRLVITLYN